MKRILIILSVVIFITGCNQMHSRIVIKGKIEHAKNAYLYLQELLVKNDGKTDSIKLDESGSFKFRYQITTPSFYSLNLVSHSLSHYLPIQVRRLKSKEMVRIFLIPMLLLVRKNPKTVSY